MSKLLTAFFEFKNEAAGTRMFALGAVVIITIGLASLSVTGIIATADWNWLSMWPIIGLILAVLGAEALATVAFIRTLTAATKLRKIAGFAIFLGLAAVGVHNAENGAHVVWPERFAESSGSLAAKAELAGKEADTLGKAQTEASNNSGAELERVRTQLADLRVEQRKMAAQSPEGIAEAQSLLLAQGKYYGSVDGIRRDKTEAAMRSRGEEIQGELAILLERETGLMAGATPVQQVTTDKSLLKIENADKAASAFWAWFWLITMLCVLESARSLSLWALITDLTGRSTDRDRQRDDELAEAEHQNRLAELYAKRTKAPPTPEPVSEERVYTDPVIDPPIVELDPIPEPAPVSHPEPVEAVEPPPAPEPPPEPVLTDAERRSRAGGLATGQAKAAARAKAERLILVPSLIERDAELAAAKRAAE